MEKIDIHNSVEDYQKGYESLDDLQKKNADLIRKYLDASSIGKTSRQQVGIRARLKNLYLLKVSAKYFKKDLDKLNVSDMEKFIKALNENKLHKSKGDPYSEKTKSNLKVCLINFLKFTMKDKKKFVELTDWIDTRFKKKDIPALSEEEIYKVLNKCNTLQRKVLISVLFDSGARIEEFLNLRLSDITEVKGDVPYYRITIRNETSKTQGRTIGLFWKPTTEIIKNWLEEHPDKDNLDAPFFPSTYDGVRMLLSRLGEKSLKKKLNPHLFRHSSATYYAGKGFDYFQLCKRYGWAISSTVPQTYIDRSGIKEKEVEDKYKNESIGEMKSLLEKYRQENQMIKADNDSMGDRMMDLQKEIKSIRTNIEIFKKKNKVN